MRAEWLLTLMLAAPPDEVARAIADLSHERYDRREAASRRLWEMADRAEPAVRAATESPDPETARRARLLVEQFDSGILFDTPPAVIAELTRYRGGGDDDREQAVRAMVQHGRPAFAVLRRLGDRATPFDRHRLAQNLFRAKSDVMPKMILAGDLAAAEELLECCCWTGDPQWVINDYVALLLLADRLAPARATWLPRALKGNDGAIAVAFSLARAAGDVAEGKRLAKLADREDMLEQVLWDAGDWKALAAREWPESPWRSSSVNLTLGFRSFCQRRGGDPAGFTRSVQTLQTLDDPVEGTAGRLAAVRMLLINECPTEALVILKLLPARAFEFDLHVARMDIRAALAVADRPATEELSTGKRSIGLQKARLLAQLGETTAPKLLFATLAEEASAPADAESLAELLVAERQHGFVESVVPQAARYLNSMAGSAVTLGTDPAPKIFEALAPRLGEPASRWWRFLRMKYPERSGSEIVQQAIAIVDPTRSPKTPVPVDLATAFLNDLSEDAPEAAVRRLHALSAAYFAAGQEDEARNQLKRAAGFATAGAWFKLGDFERARKRWADAAAAYRHLAGSSTQAALGYYLEADCQRQLGQIAEARRLSDLAHRYLLGLHQRRLELADELERRGLSTDATRERDFVVRALGYREWYVANVDTHRARDAVTRQQYSRAADLYERTLGGCVRYGSQFLDPAGYLKVPALVRLHRAEAALVDGKVDAACAEADAILTQQPGQIDVAMRLVPELQRRGATVRADELYSRATEPYRRLLTEYPDCPFALNDLSMAAACCRRDLDDALVNAIKATALRPLTAEYHDTLAEVHFQRGDRVAALTAIRRAAELAPENAYIRAQAKRMQAGSPDSPLPARDDD